MIGRGRLPASLGLVSLLRRLVFVIRANSRCSRLQIHALRINHIFTP